MLRNLTVEFVEFNSHIAQREVNAIALGCNSYNFENPQELQICFPINFAGTHFSEGVHCPFQNPALSFPDSSNHCIRAAQVRDEFAHDAIWLIREWT
jgi:hypothetical protein